MKKIFLFLFISLFGISLSSCKYISEPKDAIINSIVLAEKKITISEGESYILTATPSDERLLVFWYTRDSSIATVKDGLVTGLSAGETVCYAQSGESVAMCSIVVTPYKPDNALNVYTSSEEYVIQVNDSFSPNFIVKLGDEVISNYKIECSISDSSVLSFNDKTFTGLKAGSSLALLTFTYETYTDQILLSFLVK